LTENKMILPHGWQLPVAISERLGESVGRQRAIAEEGHLLLVLHKLPSAEGSKRQGLLFWRNAEGEWKSSEGREGVGALRVHLDAYSKVLEALDEAYERSQNAHDLFVILESAVPLHRAATNQAAALQIARESLPDAREIITLRDQASDIERAAELVHSDAKNALDYQIARQGEEQARLGHELSEAGHRLNLLAALFLPLSVIGGLFANSLKTGLEEAPIWVFWALLAGALVMGWMLRGKAPRK
jgi:hypothetical protein